MRRRRRVHGYRPILEKSFDLISRGVPMCSHPARCRSLLAAIIRSAFPACAGHRAMHRQEDRHHSFRPPHRYPGKGSRRAHAYDPVGSGRPTLPNVPAVNLVHSASAAGRCRAKASRWRAGAHQRADHRRYRKNSGSRSRRRSRLDLAWERRRPPSIFPSTSIRSIAVSFPAPAGPSLAGFLPREALKLLGLVCAQGILRIRGRRSLAAL